MVNYPFINGILLAVTAQEVVVNVAMGVAIVLALLVLRAIIAVLGRVYLANAVSCVFVNVSSEEEAVRIGQVLIEERLVAAVNITQPIRSFYRWQGKVEDRTEVLMIIKTFSMRSQRVVHRVAELHSYQVPSILAFPATLESHKPYRDWVAEATDSKPWWKFITRDDILPSPRPIWKR